MRAIKNIQTLSLTVFRGRRNRLNTIQDMERIVMMDKGQVVSKGTHQELMKDCSLYRDMTETQERVSKWQLKEEEE